MILHTALFFMHKRTYEKQSDTMAKLHMSLNSRKTSRKLIIYAGFYHGK